MPNILGKKRETTSFQISKAKCIQEAFPFKHTKTCENKQKETKHMYQVYTAPSPYINVIQVHKPIESNSVVE